MEQDRQGVEIEKLREYADLDGKYVLEVGCGNGRASAMLAPLVGSLVAIDPDEERLRKARARAPGVDFRQGSGESLDFPDESFDIVMFTFSLHHQDAARALDEAYRVLRPGGQALVIEPAPKGDMHRLFSQFNEEDIEINAALDAMENSKLSRGRSETFEVEYIFDDAEDVYDYFFGEYGMARDESYIERMNAVLGNRVSERPIRLFESVNIRSLFKT